MRMITITSAAAVTALLASTSIASAVDLTGGSVGLTYAQTDFGLPDTLDATEVYANAAFSLTSKIGVAGFAASEGYSVGGTDTGYDKLSYGLSPSYKVSSAATLGLFFERQSIDLSSSSSFEFNVSGIEGSLKSSETIMFSGYWGQYSGSDVSGPTVYAAGIRADFSMSAGLGLFASYQRDADDTFTANRTTVGVSYNLRKAMGTPVMLEASYASLGGDSYLSDFDQFVIGGKFMFGPSSEGTGGFLGNHTVVFNHSLF